MKKLLIIEDNADTSSDLNGHYADKSWTVEVAASISEANRLLNEEDWQPHVIIADLGLPDGDILAHLENLSGETEFSEWIFAFEEGDNTDTDRIDDLAYDFMVKPFDQKRLDIVVNRALRSALTRQRLQRYASSDTRKHVVNSYLGKSKPVQELRTMLRQLAEVPISTMIITGETGTGKGLVARIVHHTGLRKEGPMVELNCAALPRELLESQLFGHEAGAFTGAKGRHRGLIEQADGGTLFLDEIGDMDIELQAKLLKAIEDKKIRRLGSEREISVDVQFIAATGIDLEQASRQNEFREDLYHRLSVFCVTLTPLRERKEDLVEILPPILAEFNEKANKHVEYVPDEVWEALLTHDWPGNVRELRNVIERCVLLAQDEILPAQWLQLNQFCAPDTATDSDEEQNAKPDDTATHSENSKGLFLPLDGSMALDEMDSHIIQTALQQNEFNVTETARVLGATRETLRYRIRKYDLQTEADVE